MGRNRDAAILKHFHAFLHNGIVTVGTVIGPELDTSNLQGRSYWYCSVGLETAGIGQTFTLEHSDVSGSGFVAVPLADLPNNVGGQGFPGAPLFGIAFVVFMKINNVKRFLRMKAVQPGGGISSFNMYLKATAVRAPAGLNNANLIP